jgi:hypothetical protein
MATLQIARRFVQVTLQRGLRRWRPRKADPIELGYKPRER